MHYLYLIKSISSDFIYIGTTNDLKRRFAQHDNKKEIATKAYAPFKLIYYEAFKSKKDAMLRERKLKHHGSVVGHLKKRLRNSFIE